jgi:hypothetical protein
MVLEAQKELVAETSTKGLNKHMMTRLYPIMGRVIVFIGDLGDVFQDLSGEVNASSEFLSAEDADYLSEYMGVVEAFVRRWYPEAERMQAGGAPILMEDLMALEQGRRGVMDIVGELTHDGEEEETDGGNS